MEQSEASFTRIDQSTEADFDIMLPLMAAERTKLADRVLDNLKQLGGLKFGLKVDRLEHSLQTATRAMRDSAGEETVVVALLHDIGDHLAPDNHGALAAEILRPFVTDENYWVARHHPVFQGYFFFDKIGRDRDARERYRGHPHFEATAKFCELWDCPAFDPGFDTMPLAAFEPMVRRLFDQPRPDYS
jgi:predicted HD phosphohydrolase